MKDKCCFMGCEKDADWEFYSRGKQDSICHACDAHLSDLLEDGTSIVYTIEFRDK